jgi:hypothetical protein
VARVFGSPDQTQSSVPWVTPTPGEQTSAPSCAGKVVNQMYQFSDASDEF